MALNFNSLVVFAAVLQSVTCFLIARHHRRSTPFPSIPTRLGVQLYNSNSKDSEEESLSFDMTELQKRMDQQLTQYYDLFTNDDEADTVRPDDVYIIVFNPGKEDEGEQGVHTIEFPLGSGNNVILAFENDDECIDFARMLKDMQFYDPVPQMANLEQLEEFCNGMGVGVKVVPENTRLRPPADNVEELQMNPNLRKDKDRLNRAFMATSEENDKDESESAWE